MPGPRINQFVDGKEINLSIKKPGATAFILFACVTSVDFSSPGVEVVEIACRSGVFKSPGGDAGLPTISLENMVRYHPTAEKPTNISDEEVQQWNDTGALVEVKYMVGDNTGDFTYTGPGFFNGFSRKGPAKGKATSSATFNFTAMPVRTAIV